LLFVCFQAVAALSLTRGGRMVSDPRKLVRYCFRFTSLSLTFSDFRRCTSSKSSL
jgi:hypothetical protein